MKFGTDIIHVPLRMNCNDFDHPLTFEVRSTFKSINSLVYEFRWYLVKTFYHLKKITLSYQ